MIRCGVPRREVPSREPEGKASVEENEQVRRERRKCSVLSAREREIPRERKTERAGPFVLCPRESRRGEREKGVNRAEPGRKPKEELG